MKTHTVLHRQHGNIHSEGKTNVKEFGFKCQANICALYGHFQRQCLSETFLIYSITVSKKIFFPAKPWLLHNYTLWLHCTLNLVSSVIPLIRLFHPWGQDIAVSSVTKKQMGAARTSGTNYHASNKPFL